MRAWTTRALVVLAAALSLPAAGPATAATSLPALFSDATGPLFTADLLEPGAPLEQCLRLSWSAAGGTVLGVSARVVGDLAPYLDVTVQTGSGGGYDDCGKFVAAGPQWSGTLAGLAGTHDAPARQAPLQPMTTGAGSATVRIAVTVHDDDRAQALDAAGDVVFALVAGTDAPEASLDDPGTSGRGDLPTSSDAPSASTDDLSGPPAAGRPPTAPPAQDDATVTVPMSPGEPGAPGADDAGSPGVADGLLDRDPAAAGALTPAVWWTLWALPLLLLLLLLRKRREARDTRLAATPAEAVPGRDDEAHATPPVVTRPDVGDVR
ncbi:hypothetical protein [Cellulomonas sp. S1-8]|uniref:hypothetical protein n=1 Tax=Cellulomonas sp. S1-8 TaxID=2904790 RepID=UPI00224318E0|nr:hypothetical protein [Cellulomonas sp. S1-8]UZN02926.1 hypothetical protein OKX07_18030 [Cellulomonas sp. S1-8]